MSDRLVGDTFTAGSRLAARSGPMQNSGEWRGTVTRNDNSTAFETTHLQANTRYGKGALAEQDNLFEAYPRQRHDRQYRQLTVSRSSCTTTPRPTKARPASTRSLDMGRPTGRPFLLRPKQISTGS